MIGCFWTASRDPRTWGALITLGIFAGLMICICSVVGHG